VQQARQKIGQYRRWLLSAILLPLCISGSAQIEIKLIFSDSGEELNERLRQASELVAWQEKTKQQYWEEGFLAFTIDTLYSLDGKNYLAKAYKGPPLFWGQVEPDSSIERIYRTKYNLEGRALRQEEFKLFHADVLKEFANSGYPFAESYFRNIVIDKQQFNAELAVDKGPLVVFDSLIIISSKALPAKYISQYLEIKKGQLFDERIIQRIPARLKEIPFIQQSGATQLLFDGNKVNVYVSLEDRKASFVNGIAGLQPDENNEKYSITGQLDLKLLNSLRLGETFIFNWRRIQVQTQDLALEMQYPYLFGSPVGVEGRIKIFRRDSTFNSVGLRGGLVYLIPGGQKIKLFTEKTQNTALGNSLQALTLGSSTSSSYGIGIEMRNTDQLLNPRRGYTLQAEVQAGRRTLRDTLQNSDGLVLPGRTEQYLLSGTGQVFIPLRQRMTMMLQSKGGYIDNSSVMLNEMFRFGGFTTLRGADEESVYATAYTIGTLEWRLLLGEYSRFFVFYDVAWYERKSSGETIRDIPAGVGSGISFETKGGIFGLTYALGKSGEQGFEFRSSRIHFGFTSLF
jgi:outer membrane protein assembly factor BamA